MTEDAVFNISNNVANQIAVTIADLVAGRTFLDGMRPGILGIRAMGVRGALTRDPGRPAREMASIRHQASGARC